MYSFFLGHPVLLTLQRMASERMFLLELKSKYAGTDMCYIRYNLRFNLTFWQSSIGSIYSRHDYFNL